MSGKGIAAAVVAAALAAGCAEQPSRETIGTGVGAAVGGLLGEEITDSTAGTVLGGVIGAIAGGEIGRRMEVEDRQRAYTALENNTTESWINPETDARYTFQPTETFRGPGDRVCREYRTTAVIEGDTETVTGTACQRADGTWEVIG